MDIKEQKLAAARKKLKKYQKKKETARVVSANSSRENTPNHEYDSYDKSGSLSRTSSVSEIHNEQDKLTPLIGTSDSINNYPNEVSDIQNLVTEKEIRPIIHDQPTIETPIQSQMAEVLQNSMEQPVLSHQPTPPVVNTQYLNNTTSESALHDGSISSDTTNITATTAICMDGTENEATSLRSTSETLRQLSFQMSGLVQDSENNETNYIPESLTVELEKRNNELAVLLEQERQKSFQYSQLNNELNRQMQSYESQLGALQSSLAHTSTHNTEVSGLREQLQVHIQTIGILVAEKSELQSTLAHSRHSLEQKTGEVTELQGRLDASRHRVRELEASVHEHESQNTSLSQSLEMVNQQLSNLQANNSKTSKLQEELKASSAELKERLTLKTEESQKFGTELVEMKKQLDSAQVHIQQLRDNTLEDNQKEFEHLQIAFNESQSRIQFLNNSLENAKQERAQMENEYKTFASQLSAEVQSLQHKLSEEGKQTEDLRNRNSRLGEQIKTLEQSSQLHSSTPDIFKENEGLKTAKDALESERTLLLERVKILENDNGHLSQMLGQHRRKLEELESEVERNASEGVNTTQLLKSMQSDKVAAARALTQNKQLKHQLEELQNGLILMSNKKLELTERLETELHAKKKLNLELFSLGEQVSSLKEALLVKERENETLRKSDSKNAFGVSQSQIDSSNNTIELSKVRESQTETELPSHPQNGEAEPLNNENSFKNDCSLDTAKQDDGSSQLCEEPTMSNTAEVELHKEETTALNGVVVSNEAAHHALEVKFTKCMGELATISDEKQRLDHLVQQLQVETDTVGDYITIYQFQRGVMKQRMEDMNSELSALRLEKDQMRKKLSTLQDLVSQLVLEKAPSEQKLISGLYSFINSDGTTPQEANDKIETNENSFLPQQPTNDEEVSNGSERDVPPPEGLEIKHKDANASGTTVQQIMTLISEMEATHQIDHSLRHEFHHCPLCSGKLITI